MIKNYLKEVKDECHNIPEQVAHSLLKIIGLLTNTGEIEKDYTKAISINLGGMEFYSDSYYGQIYL